jgi:hypothetical protein
MKKLLLILLLVIGSAVYAQEESLLGEGEITNGGFGAAVVKFTSINSQFGVLVGGRGGWIINHSIILGAGGYGLTNQINGTISNGGRYLSTILGYGGFEMEYIINSDNLVHTSVSLLIGGGAVSQRNNIYPVPLDWSALNIEPLSANNFFIAEPEVDIEVNIVKFFRIDFGASYRIISGVNQNGLKNSDVAGVSVIMTLKFGKF